MREDVAASMLRFCSIVSVLYRTQYYSLTGGI
jgi:hypothetical protein